MTKSSLSRSLQRILRQSRIKRWMAHRQDTPHLLTNTTQEDFNYDYHRKHKQFQKNKRSQLFHCASGAIGGRK